MIFTLQHTTVFLFDRFIACFLIGTVDNAINHEPTAILQASPHRHPQARPPPASRGATTAVTTALSSHLARSSRTSSLRDPYATLLQSPAHLPFYFCFSRMRASNVQNYNVPDVTLTQYYVYRCDKNQRRCISSPAEEGIPCGDETDYYFGECNEAPGKCRVITFEFGSFGVCQGTPKVGIPCNDFNECTVDDKCKVVKTAEGDEIGECMGTFSADTPCNDYNDPCTINDRCAIYCTLSCSFWGFFGVVLQALQDNMLEL